MGRFWTSCTSVIEEYIPTELYGVKNTSSWHHAKLRPSLIKRVVSFDSKKLSISNPEWWITFVLSGKTIQETEVLAIRLHHRISLSVGHYSLQSSGFFQLNYSTFIRSDPNVTGSRRHALQAGGIPSSGNTVTKKEQSSFRRFKLSLVPPVYLICKLHNYIKLYLKKKQGQSDNF